MNRPTICHGTTALLGLVFGFVLSRLGFSDYGEIHLMFTFASWNLTLAFALAVVVIWMGFRVGKSPEDHAPRRIHSGTLPGGVLFGVGWALCGACPSIALVQLGEGRGTALVTLAGIVAGTWVYTPIHRRFFGWPTESCSG